MLTLGLRNAFLQVSHSACRLAIFMLIIIKVRKVIHVLRFSVLSRVRSALNGQVEHFLLTVQATCLILLGLEGVLGYHLLSFLVLTHVDYLLALADRTILLLRSR